MGLASNRVKQKSWLKVSVEGLPYNTYKCFYILMTMGQDRGGQLIWLGGYLEEAAFSGGPYLLTETEVEASLGPFSHNTNIYCDNWKKFQIGRIFVNAFAGH